MSINPIMPIGTEYYAYEPSDSIVNIIKKQLENFGYSSTGNVEKDKNLLALLNAGGAQKIEFGSETKQALPWQNILDELHLTTTGKKEDDYNLILTTIEEKLRYATDESEKQYYLDLIQKTDSAFALEQFTSNSTPYENMTGANYLSSLNAYFML